jgi:preprotein translocase subunit SecG
MRALKLPLEIRGPRCYNDGFGVFMSALLYTIHVLVSLLLIGGILLQPGAKGGGMGSVFGGGGANSAFGARGAAPILAKLTYWLAGSFMATCLTIEILVVQHGKSVLDRAPLPPGPAPVQTQGEPEAAPAAPAEPGQAEPADGAASAPAQEEVPAA